jgi:hypothetical protein
MSVVNCLYCGKACLPSKGYKKRKYCSSKCTYKQYQKEGRYYTSTAKPGYGDKSREAERLKEERRREYEEVIKAGWVDVDYLMEEFGLTRGAINIRIRKHLQKGTETKLLPHPNGGNQRFVHPSAVKKLLNPYAVPEGFLTSKQAAEYMGYSYATFHQYSNGLLDARKGRCDVKLPPSLTTVHKGSPAFLYSIDDLEKFKKNILDFRKKKNEERCLKRLAKEEEHQRQRAERKRRFEELTRGRIHIDECLPYFGIKSRSPIEKLVDEGKLAAQKIPYKGWWFKPEDIQVAAKAYKSQKRIEAQNRKKRNKWRAPSGTLQSRYEEKYEKKFLNDNSPLAMVNKKYWDNEAKGIINFFYCKACGKPKPYCEFYVDKPYKSGRCEKRCRTCIRSRWLKKRASQPKKRLPRKTDIRHKIAISVRQALSKNRGVYALDASAKMVWLKLEERCGYNKEKLIKHIEDQFVGEMSWDNHGQPGTTIEKGSFCWAIDHIKAHSSFHYTSLDDKAFVDCWSLENLRPLEWRLNVIKSNKDLRSKMSASFRYGLATKKIRGIWKMLPYTPEHAREHIEKQFDKEMNWNNYGTHWHVDHIRPQASLPYLATSCKNFNHCWSLKNLQPLLVRENNAKNSIWNSVRWLYNDIDKKS